MKQILEKSKKIMTNKSTCKFIFVVLFSRSITLAFDATLHTTMCRVRNNGYFNIIHFSRKSYMPVYKFYSIRTI